MQRVTVIAMLSIVSVIGWAAFADDVPPIVINEVCWAGAPWDATAEWIELFNTTSDSIDLEGWTLVSSDGAPNAVLHGVLGPHESGEPTSGFYLLERGSDDSVPGIAADLIYQGALTDAGETLVLLSADGSLIDTANGGNAADVGLAWPAGSDGAGAVPFASMERLLFQAEDQPENWASCQAQRGESSDRPIRGTPKEENSVYNVPPVAQLSVTPTIPHPGESALFSAEGSHDANDTITSYLWQFGDGTGAEGDVVRHTYEVEGEYALTLTLTDSKGAETLLLRTILVAYTTPPLADFSVRTKSGQDTPRAGELLTFQDESSDRDSEIVTRDWEFGDGSVAQGAVVTHTYADAGAYAVSLRVTDAQGEHGMQTRSLTVIERAPVAVFTVSPERPNQHQPARFDGSESFGVYGDVQLYRWDFDGDGIIDLESAEPIAEFVYDVAGPYLVRLVVVDDQTLQQSTRERRIDVNAAPRVQFTASSFQPDELAEVAFADLSKDPDSTIAGWSWDFGDGTASDEQSPTHTYQTSGSMTVTLTVVDQGGAVGTCTAVLEVRNLPPTAALSVANASLPTGTSFSFDASGSADPSPSGGIVSYDWSLGTAGEFTTQTSVPQLAHAFADNGTYTIQVRVVDSDGATALSEPLVVTVTNRAPIVGSVSQSIPEPVDGELVTFAVVATDPDGTVSGWTWLIDSQVMGTAATLAYAFPDDGSYAVAVRIQDNDGAVSAEYPVAVVVRNAAPIASFTAVQGTACGIASVRFDATSSYDPSPSGQIVHLAWDFGDGTQCPGSSAGCDSSDRWRPEHCYSTSGTYRVTLTVIDEQGAWAAAHQTIIISE